MESDTTTRLVQCPVCGVFQRVTCERVGCDLVWFTPDERAPCQWTQTVCSPQAGVPRDCCPGPAMEAVMTRVECGGELYRAARRNGRVLLMKGLGLVPVHPSYTAALSAVL